VDVTLENEQLENFEFAEVSNEVNAQPSKWLLVRCFFGNPFGSGIVHSV